MPRAAPISEEEREDRYWDEYYREEAYDRSDAGMYYPGESPEERVEDVDVALAGAPLVGGGSQARIDAARNRRDQLEAQRTWYSIGQGPRWEDLATQESDSDEFGSLLGDPSAWADPVTDARDREFQLDALRSLQDVYRQGGYTDADRAMSQAMRAQQAQALGGANQAALQNMQSRGMGGSGAELAMRMGAGESMNYANSQSDAQLQMAAMQRALQAMQATGQLGTAYRSGNQARYAALDAFNQANADWRRSRENRNADRVSQGRQQAYENAQNWAAGMTNQYAGAQASRNASSANKAEADKATAGLISGLLESI